jgi:hypothetical protein
VNAYDSRVAEASGELSLPLQPRLSHRIDPSGENFEGELPTRRSISGAIHSSRGSATQLAENLEEL